MLAAAHSPQPHTLQAQRGRDQWHDRHHVHLMFSLADDGASSLACMIARYDLKSTRTCKLQLEDRFSEQAISDLLIDM